MKIAASDYDGTLYQQETICRENIEAIRKWRDAGGKFGVVTGRDFGMLVPQLRYYQIEFDFAVCNNGGIIFDRVGRVLFQSRISTDVLQAIARQPCVEDSLHFSFSAAEGTYICHDSDYPGSENGTTSSNLGSYLLTGRDAVITKWFRDGLAGWRLDVAKEVPPGFWGNVRQTVKALRTTNGDEPLLLGEIWQDGTQFLTGDQFDSVMNYKLSFALGDLFLNRGDAKAADEELKVLRQNYPKEALYDLMESSIDAEPNPNKQRNSPSRLYNLNGLLPTSK